MTILDYDPDTGGFSHRIESINEKQRYEKFCRLLRDEKRVRGMDEACKAWDMEQAKISLQEFRATGDPFRDFRCHMGLHDMTYLIQVGERPVAILFSGQYRPTEGIDLIQEKVQALGTEHHLHVKLDESTRQELFSLTEELPPAPEDIRDCLRREVEHIQRIAEAEYRHGRYQWEQEFLDTVRVPAGYDGTTNLERLRQSVRELLELIRTFCCSEYVVFFASVREGDTMLAPIASVGIPKAIERIFPISTGRRRGCPWRTLTPRRGTLPTGTKWGPNVFEVPIASTSLVRL
jgi:hypothetical protein